jgi:hypothetical protein
LTRPGFTFEGKIGAKRKRVEGDEEFGAVNRKSLKRFRQLFEIDQQTTTTNLPKTSKSDFEIP